MPAVMDITPEEAAAIVKASRRSEWFIRNILGHKMWAVPRSIIRDLERPRAMVAVKSCHASGKTFTAADTAIWFTRGYGGITLVTSPSWTQVEQQIWGEIHRTYHNARMDLGGELLKTEWRLGNMNYALGMATNDGIRMQGFHGTMLIIIDEAPGVRRDILEAIEGIRAGGDVRVLMLGNPNADMTVFREAFTKDRSIWRTYTINGLETPNMVGTSLEELAGIPFTYQNQTEFHPVLDGGDPFFNKHLIKRRFIWEKYHTWGTSSPLWQAKVLGEFPDIGTDALIPLSWVERAETAAPEPDAMFDVGIDVAGPGEDETVMAVRQGSNNARPLAWDDPDPRGHVINQLAMLKGTGKLRRINVDSIGQGYYFARHIEDQGFENVHYINVGERSSDPEKYANLKAELYWGLRMRYETGDIHGIVDDIEISQTAGLKYKHNARGQIVIESKEEARRRGMKSPDRAEARMLAYANPTVFEQGELLMGVDAA